MGVLLYSVLGIGSVGFEGYVGNEGSVGIVGSHISWTVPGTYRQMVDLHRPPAFLRSGCWLRFLVLVSDTDGSLTGR